MSESNLITVLVSDDGEVVERLRADRASIYGYNLGGNPKGTRFHFCHEPEKHALGEELDPWGTPHQIESDGDLVRIESAGKNRTFARVGAEGYDDICHSVAGGSPISSDERF